MQQNLFLLGLCMTVGALGYLLVKNFLTRKQPPPRTEPEEPAPPDPMAPSLAGLVPATASARQTLQQLLCTAGFYRPSALTEYLAVRAVLVVGVLMATGLLALQVPEQMIATTVLGGGVTAVLAFSLPRVLLSGLASSRARLLRRGLPTAMDIIGLCLTAGQNLLASLDITSRELKPVNPALSRELTIVHQQAKMHSMELALTQWANRVDVMEIRSFVLLLVQSQRLGTDMVTTLLEFADNQRTQMRQRAEAQANRTSLWMLFPSVFCLWVASAIVLVGPAYIEFWKFRREQMANLLTNAKGQVERSNAAQGNANQAQPGAPQAPFQPRVGNPGAQPRVIVPAQAGQPRP